jgi:hypothetical protein
MPVFSYDILKFQREDLQNRIVVLLKTLAKLLFPYSASHGLWAARV